MQYGEVRRAGRWVADEDDLRRTLGPDALFTVYPPDAGGESVVYLDVCGGLTFRLPCTEGCVWKTIGQAALRGWRS